MAEREAGPVHGNGALDRSVRGDDVEQAMAATGVGRTITYRGARGLLIEAGLLERVALLCSQPPLRGLPARGCATRALRCLSRGSRRGQRTISFAAPQQRCVPRATTRRSMRPLRAGHPARGKRSKGARTPAWRSARARDAAVCIEPTGGGSRGRNRRRRGRADREGAAPTRRPDARLATGNCQRSRARGSLPLRARPARRAVERAARRVRFEAGIVIAEHASQWLGRSLTRFPVSR